MSEPERSKRGLRALFDRRSPWEFVAGYVLVAWIVLQVTETLASLIGLPFWFGAGVIVLLAAGLVVVALTALLQWPARAFAAGASPLRRRLGRVFTWRRTAIAGVVALALLGLATATHLSARALGIGALGTLTARGMMTSDSPVVVADFEDHTGDEALATALSQALRVHLSQSPSVLLLSPARIAGARGRMEIDPSATLTLPIAREVAIREGVGAAIGGEIHRVGRRYTVSARVLAAESGEELLSLIETASGEDELIGAVERLSLRLRERIGESLVSVRRSPPLSYVRTASLEALKSYTAGTEANGRGDFERCAVLMDEAIAEDSLFAMAYEARAACNQNMRRNYAQQIADRSRVYQMRDRMTEHERLRFTAVYHQFVTDDRVQAIQAWDAYLARYPHRTSALFALANLHAEGRNYTRAESLLTEALARDTTSRIALINMAGYQASQGRFEDALRSLVEVEAAVPGIDITSWRATTQLAAGDWEGAAATLAAGYVPARGNPAARARVAGLQGYRALTLGRLTEAESYFRETLDAESEAGQTDLFYIDLVSLAEARLRLRADTAGALELVSEGLRRHPLAGLDPLDRPHLMLAEFYARAGELAQANERMRAWDTDVAGHIPGRTVPPAVRAVFAEAEGRYDDAILEWHREDDRSEDPLPVLAHIGHLYDLKNEADSTIAYYERYLMTPARLRYRTDALWRGRILRRLGELHHAAGRPETASRYTAALSALWATADSTLFRITAPGKSRPGEERGTPVQPSGAAGDEGPTR